MPDVIELLEALPDLVDRDEPSPEMIRQRARRRTRRRRLLVAGPISLLAVVLVAVLLVATSKDPDASRVVTVTPPTTGPPSTESAATLPPGLAPSGLHAQPAVDLTDEQVISVTFDDPMEVARATFMGICDGEVVNRAYLSTASDEELKGWCSNVRTEISNPAAFRVERLISTPNGIVDCAANPGRCVVAASLDRVEGESTAMMRWSPLAFRAVAQGDVTLDVAPSEATDGTAVTVSGYGGLPGQSILLTQCLSATGWQSTDVASCDTIRDAEVPAGDDGRFTGQFILYREILTYSPDNSAPSRWVSCEPCFLVAARSNGQGGTASVAVKVDARGPAIRPTVEIVEPGPHAPGQRITLRGSGFQADGQSTTISFCASDLMSQPFAGGCYGAQADVGRPDVHGSFTVTDFPLPEGGFAVKGRVCSQAGQCAFGSVPGEGLAYLLSGPLDLTG